MKTLKTFLTVGIVALLGLAIMASCGDNKKKNKIKTYTIDQALAEGEKLVGDTITVTGVCTHVCKHGAKKMFVMGENDENTLRVEASEKVGSFVDVVNNNVTATGVFEETRIDEAYLADWEAKVLESLQNEPEHGDGEAAGCSADMQANKEKQANSQIERIENMRAGIAERTEKEGKAYLSFFYMTADSYTIVQ